MKKLSAIFFVAAVSLIGMSVPAWAQGTQQADNERPGPNEQVILGVVVKIDVNSNQVVIKHVATGELKTIVVPPHEMANLFVGDRIRVFLKDGTTIARHVRRVAHRPQHH
jgi:Cu/Ag efflux protein CusF